jgi:tRNA (guanine37-N1)-methyltransferase
MRIDVLTLFPGVLTGYLNESIISRARERTLVDVHVHDIREYTHDRHRTADDTPYGGGPGMVMKPEPIFEALDAHNLWDARTIYLTPQGHTLTQSRAAIYATDEHIVLLCGHYEGVDQRVLDVFDEELSIGDYVISNGAVAATVVIDSIARLIPGVLGNEESALQDSFSQGKLEYPQYTRPAEYRGMRVPEVLLSGDHGRISAWRDAQSEKRTRERKPYLSGCDARRTDNKTN